MLASFLLIITSFTSGPSIPNYYPGIMAAREASKKTQKEMIIFFTDATCEECESAWNSFAGDTRGTAKYISTKVDIEDFDGSIYFELLGLKNIPSWVVLHPDGTVKETWEGGWKDDQGNIIPTQVTPKSTMNASAQKVHPDASKITTQPVPNPVEKTGEGLQGNYFIQAGYFGSEANAVKLINDLHGRGFDNYTAKAEQKEGKTYYRVVSTLYQTEEEATKEQRVLLAGGISATVKKM